MARNRNRNNTDNANDAANDLRSSFAKRIIVLNYYTAQFALFLKTPSGIIFSAMVSASVSALGFLVFAFFVFLEKKGMQDVPKPFVFFVVAFFALLVTFGSMQLELIRKKYLPKFIAKKNAALEKSSSFSYPFVCVYYFLLETVFDVSYLIAKFLNFVDFTISISGYITALGVSSAVLIVSEDQTVFSFLLSNINTFAMWTGVIALAIAPPIATMALSSIFATRANTDTSFLAVMKAHATEFSDFVTGKKKEKESDENEDENQSQNGSRRSQRRNGSAGRPARQPQPFGDSAPF